MTRKRRLLVGVEDLVAHDDLVEAAVGDLAHAIDRRLGQLLLELGLDPIDVRILGERRQREHEGNGGCGEGGKCFHRELDRFDQQLGSHYRIARSASAPLAQDWESTSRSPALRSHEAPGRARGEQSVEPSVTNCIALTSSRRARA